MMLRIFLNYNFLVYFYSSLGKHQLKFKKKPKAFLHNRVCCVLKCMRGNTMVSNGELYTCIVFKHYIFLFAICLSVQLLSLQFLWYLSLSLSHSLSLSFSLSPSTVLANKIHITAHLSETLSRSFARQTCNISLFFL